MGPPTQLFQLLGRLFLYGFPTRPATFFKLILSNSWASPCLVSENADSKHRENGNPTRSGPWREPRTAAFA